MYFRNLKIVKNMFLKETNIITVSILLTLQYTSWIEGRECVLRKSGLLYSNIMLIRYYY